MPSNSIYKSFKYRLYPTPDQESIINKTFGCVRFLWNRRVAAFNSYNVEGPTQSNASIKELRGIYDFLEEVPQNALEQKDCDFKETAKQYFKKDRKKKLGRPDFKRKGKSRDSYRLSVNGFSINENTIKLAKLGIVDVVIDRPWTGIPVSITVSRNSAEQYFVSILVKVDQELKQNTGRSIGIDLGLRDLAILSDGKKIENPRFFHKNQVELKRAQKHLSRKVKGSNRYQRQKKKVARIHLGISNRRNDYLHKLTSWLVTTYDHIFMEDLNVAGMKKSNLGKSISDAALGEFIRQVEYKSSWYGRSFHKIDRFFPSSKTCSCCGFKLETLDRGCEEWTCPACHTHHDRDLNAAKNIHVRGFMELYGIAYDEAIEQINKSAEYVDYRHGETIRPKESLIPEASFDEVSRIYRNDKSVSNL